MATYATALPCPGTSMTGDVRADVAATALPDLSGWTISFELYLIATNSSGYPSSSSGNSAYLDLEGGRVVSWASTFNFPSGHGVGYKISLGSGSYTKAVTPDGTGSVSVGYYFTEGGSPTIGSGGGSGTLTLPTIPRATQPTVSPASGETGSTFTIGHTPATSSFYHDVAYSLDAGSTYTNIATNVIGTTTSTSWTPAHTLLPNDSSKTAIIRLITRSSSGGTIIGTKTANLPLTVPATVKPAVSNVTWADAQVSSPDIPTLMGGTGRYVQGWSKLIPTVTSAGAGGSTVVGAVVTLNGRTTPSGTAFALPVQLSGAVPFSAVATDTRGRDSDPYLNTVAVAAYNFPNLPTPLVARTSDAGGSVPDPTGTYLAITPAASVSSLMFGGAEKNLLEWQVRTKPVGGSWTTVQAWTSATVSGNTWTTKYVAAGPYLANTEYVVEVSIRDLFGKNGFDATNTVKVLTVLIPTESVFMDWDHGEGIGLGKYRTPGVMLDVAGTIAQGGNAVVDVGDAATTTVAGISELATNAETITGTDAGRVVTPAGLKYAYDTRVGDVEAAVTALETRPQGVIPSSVSVGSGSASVAADGTVTFSACSSGSMNGWFDGSGMDMYEVFYDLTLTANTSLLGRLRKSGTDSSTGYNRHANYWYGAYADTTAMASNGAASSTALTLGYILSSTPQNTGRIRFASPNKAQTTVADAQFSALGGGFLWANETARHLVSTAYDGFSFIVGSGTFSGTVKAVKVA